MLINPKVAIEQGWITHPQCKTLQDWIDRKFVSPNALDFTLDRVFVVDERDTFVMTEEKKDILMRGTSELDTFDDIYGNAFWTIPAKTSVDALSEFYCNIPEGVACKTIIRSTLNRNGLFITSGIYDSGYQGPLGFALHNLSGEASIQQGVRVGQIEFYKSDSSHKYEGGWNHAEGKHWSEDADVEA